MISVQQALLYIKLLVIFFSELTGESRVMVI